MTGRDAMTQEAGNWTTEELGNLTARYVAEIDRLTKEGADMIRALRDIAALVEKVSSKGDAIYEVAITARAVLQKVE
jgi:hypothetical protein